MFCVKCGNKNAEGAAFCFKCGAKTTGAAGSPPAAMDTNISTTNVAATPFVVGAIVLAKWPNDGNYYSGSISEIKDNQALVHFDDGDVSWVKLTDLAEPQSMHHSDETYGVEALSVEDSLTLKAARLPWPLNYVGGILLEAWGCFSAIVAIAIIIAVIAFLVSIFGG